MYLITNQLLRNQNIIYFANTRIGRSISTSQSVSERVIESISYHLTARFVSSLVVGDCNDESETQHKEHFCSYMDAASGADVPEAAVLDCVVGSFDSCSVVVRLVQDGLFQLNVLAVFLDSVFDPVLDVFRVVSVSRII